MLGGGVWAADTAPAAAVVIQTATLVQHNSTSNTHPGAPGNPGNPFPAFGHVWQLPGAGSTAGNTIMVLGFCPNNVTMTCKDDKGQTYTPQVSSFSASVGKLTLFSFQNTVAGVRVVTVTHGDALEFGVQACGTELAGVVGFGSTASNSGSSASPSVSLSASGNDKVFSAFMTASATIHNLQQFTGTGLLSADSADGLAAQLGASSLLLATSDSWVGLGLVLTGGVAGSVPTGIRCVRRIHENVPVATNAGGNGSAFPSTTTHNFPCSVGTALVLMVGGGKSTPSTVTDSKGNTWHQAGDRANTGNEEASAWYTLSPVTDPSLTVTIVWASNAHDTTIIFYEWVGVTQFDQFVSNVGTASTTTTFTCLTITPAVPNEAIMWMMPEAFNTAGGAPGGLIDTNFFSGQGQDGPIAEDENNLWAHVITTSTTALNLGWSPLFPSGNAPGTWAACAIALK